MKATSYYKLITENNKLSLNKPHDCDMVYYSELTEWYTSNAFRSFNIKCVLEDTIYYHVGNTEYAVGANHFLLATKQSNVKAQFDSKKLVKSICIDICPATIGEVFSVLTEKNDHNFENYLASYFRQPEFMESMYDLDHSRVGNKLKTLATGIQHNKFDIAISKEWIFDLVEQITYQEYSHFIALNNIHSLKPSTKKEIYRRVHLGKEYIDSNFLNIENIKQIADVSLMSEYHFLRSFKQVHNISPYQYLLKKRLEFSLQLLQSGAMNITRIALTCGFPDIFTFSKAFKRHFGKAPSFYITDKQ